MTDWPVEMLAAIIAADDLKIAPLRDDAKTVGTPTRVWCVEVGGALYVRPWNDARSRWHRTAMTPKSARIVAAGKRFDFIFSPANEALAAAIDDAYRAKYAGKDYLPDMISKGPRAAGVRIDLKCLC